MDNTKLVIYDQDLNHETYAVMAKDNGLGVLGAVIQLRKIARDNSINGWINEYDLNWSTVQCANKHDL